MADQLRKLADFFDQNPGASEDLMLAELRTVGGTSPRQFRPRIVFFTLATLQRLFHGCRAKVIPHANSDEYALGDTDIDFAAFEVGERAPVATREVTL